LCRRQAVVPPPAAGNNDENAKQFAVPLPTAATTYENSTQSVPQRDVAADSFRYILQDVSDAIPQGTLPQPDIPVLELAAIVEHDDVQKSLEASILPVTRNDDVHSVLTVSVPPIFTVEHVDDDVDNNVSQDREGSSASVSKGSNDTIPLDLAAVHMPCQEMRPPLPVTDPTVNASTEESQDITTSGHAIAITSPEKHSNARVQHDMELWEHIKENDRKATEEASFTPVLMRKQKQNLKTQLLDGKQPDVEIMNDKTIQLVRVTPAQHREVQISKNVRCDLDLWARIRKYDQRTAEEKIHSSSFQEAAASKEKTSVRNIVV